MSWRNCDSVTSRQMAASGAGRSRSLKRMKLPPIERPKTRNRHPATRDLLDCPWRRLPRSPGNIAAPRPDAGYRFPQQRSLPETVAIFPRRSERGKARHLRQGQTDRSVPDFDVVQRRFVHVQDRHLVIHVCSEDLGSDANHFLMTEVDRIEGPRKQGSRQFARSDRLVVQNRFGLAQK